MANTLHNDPLPRGPMLALGAVLIAVVVAVAAVRLTGVPVRTPDAAAVTTRALLFEDRPDGGITIRDGQDRQVIEVVQGEAGFLRGALRALARERHKRGLGPEQPFALIGRADGRLTLEDPATGERIDLESFGPTNAAVFVRLLAPTR